MQKQLLPDQLARDDRFVRQTMAERLGDLRADDDDRRMDPRVEDVADRARRQMHGIFGGEIQALEGAGRTAFD